MGDKGKQFQKILFPTDFSPASENAASAALHVARQNRARLYVLHVVDVSKEAAGFYVPHLSYEKLDRELKTAADEMLQRFASRAFKGFRNLELRILVGAPYKEILKFIKGNGIDLVVMGTSGMSGLDRVFFGSTTERVMRKAECPFLVIPPAK